MKHLVKISTVLLIGILFSMCQTGLKSTKIVLTNPSSIELTDKAIRIQRILLNENPAEELFPLVISPEGDTLPSQIDDLDGDKIWDELFFVTNLAAGKSTELSLTWTDQKPEYIVRTSVRFGKRPSTNIPVKPADSEELTATENPWAQGFQRYQTDGPSWENDKVGFRHYLDGRNARDVFGKKIPGISPENVGLDEQGAPVDNYHVMENWGRDILSVGNSAGIGGFGLITNNKLMRLGIIVGDTVNNVEITRFKILTEGPARSLLNFKFTGWKDEDRSYDVEENTSIWPGMYACQNSVKFSGLKGDEEMVAGLVNIHNDMPLTEVKANDKYVIVYTHDKQTYDKEWWLGLGLILPKDHYLGYLEAPDSGQLTNTYLARLKIENDKPLDYYSVACWELSDEKFTSREYFQKYIQNLADQLAVDVTINIR